MLIKEQSKEDNNFKHKYKLNSKLFNYKMIKFLKEHKLKLNGQKEEQLKEKHVWKHNYKIKN